MQNRLQRTTPRQMAAAGRLSGLLIQAFKSMGEKHLAPAYIQKLRVNIPTAERAKVMKGLVLDPAWMRPFLRQVAEGDGEI
jgi:hypothetical protein